jgi:hypothetical protein
MGKVFIMHRIKALLSSSSLLGSGSLPHPFIFLIAVQNIAMDTAKLLPLQLQASVLRNKVIVLILQLIIQAWGGHRYLKVDEEVV